MNIVQYLSQIGTLLEQIGPKSEKAGQDYVMIEGGPMQFANGSMAGRVYGPFPEEDSAHNFLAVKIERHRLSNAAYHGHEGRAPDSDKTYMGHPMFQYRIMAFAEFATRYLHQIIAVAQQAQMELVQGHDPEVYWPNRTEEDEFGGILDDDEWTGDPVPEETDEGDGGSESTGELPLE
ncbi:hypothetical protein CMI47_04550 [Candidatus Pacearchaeota archaeon]|nr:hypothetical protein [Candidatus Pacearchaeota archaeon]